MAIRVGLIGCGKHCSEHHAQVLSARAQVQIMAISECIFPGELAQRQHQFRIPHAFPSYEEMLRAVELDAVVISTPHTHHFRQVKRCLELGLHVLVDKPAACRATEVQELADLADAAARHLVVASQRRYDPLLCRLRARLHEAELGELRLVAWHYGRSKYPAFTTSWRNDPTLSGGGVLCDAGYHLLDSVLWLTNRRPLRVHGSLVQKGTRVETCAALALELEGAVSVHLSLHLEMPQHMVQEEIGLFGSRGAFLYQSLSLPGHVFSARFVALQANHHSIEEVQSAHDVDRAPVKNFLNAIMNEEPVHSSGRASIETVRTIEWIYRGINGLGQDGGDLDDAIGRLAGERFHKTRYQQACYHGQARLLR